MEYKQFKRKALLSAAAATAIYSVVTGKGAFNKFRFRQQHEELSRYVDCNYPDCTYSAITMHGNGWSSVIKRYGRVMCYIYFSKGEDGDYIFTESQEKLH